MRIGAGARHWQARRAHRLSHRHTSVPTKQRPKEKGAPLAPFFKLAYMPE